MTGGGHRRWAWGVTVIAALLWLVMAAPSVAGPRRGLWAGRAMPSVTMRRQILGGTAASGGDLPWLAYVQRIAGDEIVICTGAVIAPNVVLSAAHCAGQNDNPASYLVGTGSADLGGPGLQVSAVYRELIDPAYSPTGANDAMLLLLVTPTTAPPLAMAAPGSTVGLAPGTPAIFAGWGLTSASATVPSTVLEWGLTQVQSAAACSAAILGFDPGSRLCTLDSRGPADGVCHGDSGSPLISGALAGETGPPVDIGIAQGSADCSTSVPDVFIPVASISAWASGVIALAGVEVPPGLYAGTTAQRRSVRLRVAGDALSVSSGTFGYRLTCPGSRRPLAGMLALPGPHGRPWQLTDRHFTLSGASGRSRRYVVSGTFGADGTVSGRLSVWARSRRGGSCSGRARWQATLQ